MALNLTMPDRDELKPKITVFGVGGAGGNAVNNMIEKELEGVDFVVANTDAQALQHAKAAARIQMGVKVTEGLGAGARPSVGAAAAEESIEQIVDHLAGAHMCFITAGMGGGTGTGAAPIIAQAARELGVLTVGVVTKPFQFEGAKRMRQAEEGVEALQKMVDTLIIIPNQNLFRLANEKTTFTEAFSMADDVLYQGVKGVTDLMVRPGLINLDFADVRAVMDEMGKAMMGTGEASGENRAIEAAEKAIANPLLDEISLRGAKGVLINITGGHDLTLFELDEAANRIREEVDPEANIIVGSTMDSTLEGMMRVSVVATGIDANQSYGEMPVARRRLAEPLAAPAEVEEKIEQAPAAPVAAQVAPMDEPAQPTLDVFDPQVNARAEPQHDARYEQRQADFRAMEDDVPAPAYQPRPQPAPQPAMYEPEADAFVAPRAPSAGTPSPEALARLQAAVAKQPRADMRADPHPQADPNAGKAGRFGINSLIGRMTGHGSEAEARPVPQPQAQPQARFGAQPQVRPQVHQAYDEDQDPNPEAEKIEIPAFLRRQAN
ncbi:MULTISPECIES: cell division protein FtsZ [Roseobacteraceae]|uniref:Cell division protein FtsZ n=1 Tax=Celeribacter baekdonensis B30 TaxID=1208323 RepID=K2K751_9RHOB|nr:MULTISPECIES: cell division protein FtsZ [Roseobacteraceae]EKE73200.1 cell division protein FtsZ [Celeribacter baekdonensis B30]KAB6714434.1 cell division protein FtsZ [Roseobacter sp. TSBP12]|tara:strand:+ start:2285 stop:3934 length:1650 start_codon:yes stop_codon:yes gene_type:complete